MKILVISDIHGDTEKLKMLAPKFKEAGMVLFAGDFAKDKEAESGKPVLDLLVSMHENVFAVIGNCDSPDFLSLVEEKDISAERTLVFYDKFAIAGSGGGSKFTGTTLFERTEDELLSDFGVIESSAEQCADENGHWKNLILIMHNPPKDTECDKIPGGIHVGSEKLRAFIEKTSPLLVVTGHIHESAGIDKIGESVVVNPGSLAEGRYAFVETGEINGKLKVLSAELFSL